MKFRKPFIIFLLSITVLAFADSCKSKNVYGRRGGGGGRRGGCDCPGIGH
ncbi:MAG: hypothetical protein M0D57_13460 [Sphingobacteriales bacterium JAD_PAG50586_3]|nr:MAG: hypothetical protein M0D57_13460 [Sphingobacteriales bacterium JAD_PAG50586_3]